MPPLPLSRSFRPEFVPIPVSVLFLGPLTLAPQFT